MKYIIYAKDPAKDTCYGPMNLQEGTYMVRLDHASLISDLDRAEFTMMNLAATCPHMSFQVRPARSSKVIYQCDGQDLLSGEQTS